MSEAPSSRPDELLRVKNLDVRFPIDQDRHSGGILRAVVDVDLELRAGETLALVGESGCGKSTLAKAICGLIRPYRGSVSLEGVELTTLSRRKMRSHRRALQMVFQDPEASLNPRMTPINVSLPRPPSRWSLPKPPSRMSSPSRPR